MALPDLIEIVPLDKPVRAEITVPGSKSITNRALILAALAEGETTLQGALWSEDTQVMVECLQELGFMVNVEADPDESCNRTIIVYGKGGVVPRGGTEDQPLELHVGNAGTAARFLSAFVCLGQGTYRLQGVPRMHERPQAALFKALRELGYRVESPNDKLPAVLHGTGPRVGKCKVSIQESSQFASALVLCARIGGWKVEIDGENADEAPYVVMTEKLAAGFPKSGGSFQIEPDASSGSYFVAAGELLPPLEYMEFSRKYGVEVPTTEYRTVKVAGWPKSGWQIDEHFPQILRRHPETSLDPEAFSEVAKKLGLPRVTEEMKKFRDSLLHPKVSRAKDLGDSIMTAITIAPFREHTPLTFTDLGRLRLQECERVAALRTELTKCGVRVEEEGDTLTVYPSKMHGAEIETYDDHRMAMCFAIPGLKVPGIKLKNPSCVKKTFPNFFQKLAAAPPAGLGVTILDAKNGRKLSGNELFAE